MLSDQIIVALITAVTTVIVGVIPVAVAFFLQKRQIDQQDKNIEHLERELNAKINATQRNKVQLEQIEAYRRLWGYTAAIRGVLSEPKQLFSTLLELYHWYNSEGYGVFLSDKTHDLVVNLVRVSRDIALETPSDKYQNKQDATLLISRIRHEMRVDIGLFSPSDKLYEAMPTLPIDFPEDVVRLATKSEESS